MTNIQDTSIEAYEDTEESRRTVRERVYNLIRMMPDICDLEISKNLGMPINSVTGRRNELLKEGLIKSDMDKISPMTGKRVRAWRTTSYKAPRIERSMCEMCKGNGCSLCGGKGYTEKVIG